MGKEWDRLRLVRACEANAMTLRRSGVCGEPSRARSAGWDMRHKSQTACGGPIGRRTYDAAVAPTLGHRSPPRRQARAYLLAFGGTRTVHRLTVALEDAGWIIRDMLVWGYASGFPKSKASLKPAWEPIVMARKPGPLRTAGDRRVPDCATTRT